MISETDILNCFKHLVEASIDDDQLVVGSGDDAAVIKSNTKDLVHSLDVSTTQRSAKMPLQTYGNWLISFSDIKNHRS